MIDFDTCLLAHTFHKTNSLFFHYSDIHCSTCLDKQLLYLKQFQTDMGAESICILGSVQSYRSIVALINNYNFECDVFVIPDQKSIFKHNSFFVEPFYFTIQNDGNINLFHFPLVKDTTSTIEFLNLCRQKITLLN